MRFKNPLKRKDSLFKEINKQTKAEIKEIKKISDPAERLARYQALNAKFPTLYGEGQVQKSVNRIDIDREEIAFNAGGPAFMVSVIGGAVGTAATVGTALFPPLLPAVAVLAASTAVVARHMTYRGEAKRRSLKTRDVKFAVRTQRLEKKVGKTTKALALAIETQRDLDKLRGTFKGAAEPAVTGEVQNVAPAVANRPATLKLQ